MPVPSRNKFCFFVKLEAGGYIIGILGLVYATLFIIGFLGDTTITEDPELYQVYNVSGTLFVVGSVFLLLGTYKRKSRLILVWHICYLLIILFHGLYAILKDINILKGGVDVLMVLVIQFYFWYFVLKLSQLFRSEESLLLINNCITVNEPSTDLPPNNSDVFISEAKV